MNHYEENSKNVKKVMGVIYLPTSFIKGIIIGDKDSLSIRNGYIVDKKLHQFGRKHVAEKNLVMGTSMKSALKTGSE